LATREVQAKQFLQVAAIELERSRPVETVEAGAFLEACLVEMPVKRLLIAALHFVGENQGEEGGVIEVLGAGEDEDGRLRRRRARWERARPA